MDPSFSTSSRRSYDIPTPETGLAEWTSKIKALQREVDADEEAEQKRLEEEISAARQARLRRSRGAGSRAGSVDISNSKEHLQKFDSPHDTSTNDAPKSAAERASGQEIALRKLMGRNDVYNPDQLSASARSGDTSSPRSLASFIGGHATGPRLNRHAPQQDAHDPTQFIQPDLSAPHPVFGKGGIAMPGLASRGDNKSTSSAVGSELSERYQPSSVKNTPLKSPSAPPMNQSAEPISKPNQQDSFDTLRSFTSKDSFSSPELSTNKPAKSESFSDINTRARNEPSAPTQSNQNTDSTMSKASNFTSFAKEHPSYKVSSPLPSKPVEIFRSAATPASKPLPSYLGTANTSKQISSLNSSVKTEPNATAAQTPLRRLMETNNVHNPDKNETARKSIAERAQGVSLAGFMGGNASGPRLNRPAPQPDAHDPTQFIQPDTSSPHPIFGRGGIAMPGLATRKDPGPVSGSESTERYRPSSGKKAVWPPVQTSYTEKLRDERPVSPQKTGSRERTTSAPGSRPFGSSQSSGNWSASTGSYTQVGRQSPTKEKNPATPIRDRTLSGPSNSPSTPIVTPSLARSIQPIPKSSSISPLIPSAVSSPAFQKPAPSKDLTPSISRLQGRGFVQSMVKVSSQLDVSLSPTPASADRSRPPSASGKKGSVLDRWQPHIQSPSPTKSTGSSVPNSMRRSATQEPTSHASSPRTPVSSTGRDAPHTLKSMASLPSLAKPTSSPSPIPFTEEPTNLVEPYRSRTPGLGSATTMVLIKPSKSATDLKQLAHVDELGVKHDSGQGTQLDRTRFRTSADTTQSSKKPLIHPTKDRARKPNKKLADPQNLESAERNAEQDDVPVEGRMTPRARSRTLGSEPVTHVQVEKQASVAPLELSASNKKLLSRRATNNADDIPDRSLSPALSPKISPGFFHGTRLPELELNNGPELNTFRNSVSAPSSPMVPSFGKLSRTPSTGSRPTVMQVAQALLDQVEKPPPSPVGSNTGSTTSEVPSKSRSSLSQMQAEKRKSTYEKYSSIILPPLKEEATPTPTPTGTLNLTNVRLINTEAIIPEESQAVGDDSNHETKKEDSSQHVLHLPRDKVFLPDIEVATILKNPFSVSTAPLDQQTISVEVLSITGSTAAPVAGPIDIFYESEILAVIHRIKSKSSGLATTFVWCWLGRRSHFGDGEERKLHDLAKRYGTSAKIVHQLAEPPELVEIFGGTLAIRQGTRTHWSPDNTTMHLARSLNSVIIIDEHDLNARNLCSAFSYCLTILGSIYVWHGCGSTLEERNAAVKYANRLSNGIGSPTELLEGETDNDEMFWMILGDDDFAKADYWKWRKSFSAGIDPMIWRVDPDNRKSALQPVQFISLETRLQDSVYVINCVWELFVLVGKDARSNRRSIRLALDVATKISKEVASSRPYAPTVHALALPSKIPLDLRLGIRDFDEAWLNNGDIPDHMNLLSCSEATTHLSRESWEQPALKDHDMLPLGVGLPDVAKN